MAIMGIFGLLAILVMVSLLIKPRRNGAAHNEYFATLSTELQSNNLFKPTILLDLDLLDQNIQTMKDGFNGDATHRIPVKSLPCLELIDYIMTKSGTNKLMVFHQPFLNLVAERFPRCDVLLGKPMPVGAARKFYQALSDTSTFSSSSQLQWLIDTNERLEQYLGLAKELKQKMRINIEIDIGLHRGGFIESESVERVLDLIHENGDVLEFSGFMGYDPHVVKLPSLIKSVETAFKQSQETYNAFIEAALAHKLNLKLSKLCLNGAGSPTFKLHQKKTVCNDLTVGSCLVKPTDFDVDILDSMRPAAFISTPVLKHRQGTWLPGGERLTGFIKAWNPNREQSFYLYGGKWMASYASPKGLIDNSIIGFSTNQQIVNGSRLVNLKVDDFVFLRPHQSEFVMLQFGKIRTIREGEITDNEWPVFPSNVV